MKRKEKKEAAAAAQATYQAESQMTGQEAEQGTYQAPPQETKKCKHCQSDIPKDAKVCPYCRKKQGGKGKIVLLIIVIIIVIIIIAAAAGGGSSSSGSASSGGNSGGEAEEAVKEYVSEDEIVDVFSNPDNYKGKYIQLTGKMFNTVDETSSQLTLQAYYDIENYDDSFIVYAPADCGISEDDYFVVDGEITGTKSGTNMLGATLTLMTIEADEISEISYIDAVVPTISEITPEDAVSEQHDISVTVDKVQFAETETRVWVTITNGSDAELDLYTSSARVLQDGTQYDYNWDSSTIYNTDEAEPSSSILAGASTSGLVIFPALDTSEDFDIYFSGYSENWEISLDDFVITIPASE